MQSADLDQGSAPVRLLIAGSGLDAWLTASVLSSVLEPARFALTLLADLEGSGTGPAADTTQPVSMPLHPALQLDETRIVTQAEGQFSFGVACSGWARPGTTWFQPYSALGAPLGPAAFHHLVLRLRGEGLDLRMANYSLAALAAQAGRFERPGNDPRSVLSTCRYGVHLDTQRFTNLLRDKATAAGVTAAPGALAGIEHDARGGIAAVVSSTGERLVADLYLDCTGSAARLAGNLPGTDWQDWRALLPCDRSISAVVRTFGVHPPYSHAQAHSAGWLRHVPLHGKTQLTSFHQADHMDDATALAGLQAAAADEELLHLKVNEHRPGQRSEPWRHNCLALGASAVCIDPLGASGLQLLRNALSRLLQLLPGGTEGVEAAEYNRLAQAEWAQVRDFAAAHFALNGRQGEAFWDACRSVELPAALDYRLRLYAARGKVVMYDEEPYEDTAWISLFDESGVTPRQFSPLANGFSREELESHLNRMRSFMHGALLAMPTHADYLFRMHGIMGPKPSTVDSVSITPGR